MTEHTDFFVEKVASANDRGEDSIVAALIITVLSVAALLLWLRQPPQVVAVERVPDGVRQVLTELSVAATEISMVAELDGKLPSIEVLRESGLTPFANASEGRWVEIQPGCAFGISGLFGVSLGIDGRLTHISWREISGQFFSKVDGRLADTLCNVDALIKKESGWNMYEPLQLIHKSTDDKHPH